MRFENQQRNRNAFTLVEVILAILIISAIMGVLLYFYQRAAEVRQTAIEETEFISVGRLLMEQLTTELRTARVVDDQVMGLDGTSNSITFICTTIPAVSRWLVNTNESLQLNPSTDLKRVHYSLLGGTNSLQARGIERVERLLAAAPLLETNLISDTETTFNDLSPTNDLSTTNNLSFAGRPLTDKVQFLQFRYWDGQDWYESWTGLDLPAGVEISVGRQPIPNDAEAEGYPYEIFRRVIFLPQSDHPGNQVVLDQAEEEAFL
jgi:type II secretory pathway pseudopilin PulG